MFLGKICGKPELQLKLSTDDLAQHSLKLGISRKYSNSLHRRDWNFLGVQGFGRPKNFEMSTSFPGSVNLLPPGTCMKLNENFQRDLGETKITSVGGGMDIFLNYTMFLTNFFYFVVERH